MTGSVSFNRNLIHFGIPLALFAGLIWMMKSTLVHGNNALVLGITADLLLTVPLVYFLLIRKTEIPKTTVVPVMILGLLIGSYFLPQEGQTYINLFKTWALPVIELSVVTFVVIKVRRAIRTYRNQKGESLDFFEALKNTCREILPQKMVLPFATEVAVIYYGFIHWKRRELKAHEFSYHRNSGTPALLGAVIMVVLIETFAFHLLLARWSPTAAWILSGLSLYTALQVFGFAKALSHRPIALEEDHLVLRYSLMNETRISYENIESIELSQKELEKDKLTKTLCPFGELESHNVVLTLSEVNTLIGLYGFKKKYKVIALHVDEPADFKEALEGYNRAS